MMHIGKAAGKLPANGAAWLAGIFLLQSCIWDSEGERPGAGPDPYPFRGHYSISAPGPFNAVHLDSGLHVSWRSSPQDSGADVSLQLIGDSGFVNMGSGVPDNGRFDFDLRGVPLP